MPWPEPTKEEWTSDIEAFWAALRSSAASTPFSDTWIYKHTLAHISKYVQEMVSRGIARLFFTTSSGTWLDRLLYFIGRKDGQGGYGLIKPHVSSGTDCLAVTFTGVGTINPTHELLDDVGNRLKINETYTSGGAEVYNADLESIDTGLAVNLETGETLTFVNPPANVNSTGTLVADLDEGADQEEDEAGRAAGLKKMQSPSLSGNWAQFQEWVEEAIPGTLDGWIWKKRNNAPYGSGTTDYFATQRGEVGADRIWTSAQKTTVGTYLAGDAEAPALHVKQARGLTGSAQNRALSYTYKLSESAPASNECDWDASAEKRTITAYDKPTKLITVGVAYGTGPPRGEKVFIGGAEATVVLEPGNAAAPVSGSMSKFTVSTWPSLWDTIGDPAGDLTDNGTGTGFAVCSGGGLVVQTFTAIEAYANGIDGDPPDGRGNLPKLGPAAGTYAAPITGWDDTFRIDMIKSAAAIAAGGYIQSHTECLIGGVAADAGPTYDSTDTIQIMTAVEIAVYEDKT